MNIQSAYWEMKQKLSAVYATREAAHIADMVMEKILSLSKTERLSYKNDLLNAGQQMQWNDFLQQLAAGKPVQYVLEEAWFCNLKFYVSEHVLIPRPETEELVEWILNVSKNRALNILDIGTGSGCIAIALKKRNDLLKVHAIDISEAALQVAKQNAMNNNAPVHFLQMDILDENQWNMLPEFDIIVSNPPYIPQREADSMNNNVVGYEPHPALFVANDNPFIFYDAIAKFGRKKLSENGNLFFEINESLGIETQAVIKKYAYKEVTIKKDMQNKDRMIRAVL
ncbi:MAG: peptide chain release factor N(5)-glutamine methyltransferase [Chitinophagaceae bacterium]|nr:peptide chain release factor N(5)-glutamine methyltransferase [Chitinophagaceae bacterium]